MASEIILVGCILGFLLVICTECSSQQKTSPPTKRPTQQKPSTKNESHVITPRYTLHFALTSWGLANITRLRPHIVKPPNLPRYYSGDYNWRRVIRTRTPAGDPKSSRLLPKTTNKKGNALVETWRKSILGLVELADRNLESARQHLEVKYYQGAVQAASTSVENIARALIHCYGGKPDPSSGQEEALKLLSRRLKGVEKIEFENALHNVARINHNRIVLKFLLRHNVQNQLFDETRTRQIVESASKIVRPFTRIIIEHFGEEIPELLSAKAQT